MLKPVRMCKIECIISQSKKEQVISRIHQLGLTQIDYLDEVDLRETGVGRDNPLPQAHAVSQLLLRVRNLIETLKPYEQTETNFLDDILGVEDITPKQVGGYNWTKLKTEVEGLLEKIEQEINETDARQKKDMGYQEKLTTQLNNLKYVCELEIPAQYFTENPYLHSAIGVLGADNEAEIETKLREKLKKEYMTTTEATQKDILVKTYHVAKEKAAELDQILRSQGFDQITTESTGTYKRIYGDLEHKIKSIEELIKETKQKLGDIQKNNYMQLLQMEELLLIEQDKINAFHNFGSTKNVTYLRLWTPKNTLNKTLKAIEENTQGLCDIKVNENPDKAPTLLDNPSVLKPFEVFTNLFSPPRYNQIDPTLVTAPTFVLFFGFMLGDAVYGLAIIALAHMLMKKYSNQKKVTDFAYILLCCGISTTVFGVLTGSFLGDFLTKYILKVEAQSLWFVVIDPLYKSNSVVLLAVAVGVGIIQTVFGNVLGLLDKIQAGKIHDALTENACWLLIGLGLLVSYGVNTIMGVLIFLVGFALLFKGAGFMAVMELPGILGKIVSYARLLALSLTTPGMGLAFNFLAALIWGIPIVGKLGAGLLFIASHIIILLMNSLGSFVHSLRLHYVEFYGTFYGGGGIEFTPFTEKRKYTVRR